MMLLLVSIYPPNTIARYLYSSYVLKAYLDKEINGTVELDTKVINVSLNTDVLSICATILHANPNIIGFSTYIWNVDKIKNVIRELKKNSNGFKIVVGGPEISESTISDFCNEELGDYFIIGEGEILLKKLILFLYQKNILELSKNVYFREGRSFNVITGENEQLNLDDLPSVYLTNTIEDRLYMYQQAFIETQRGCRYKCSYCIYHKNLNSIKYFKIDRIIEELYHLIVVKRVNTIRFLDAIFPTDLKRAKKIINYLLELKDKNYTIPWIYWEFFYNFVDEDFLQLTSLLKTEKNVSNYLMLSPMDKPQLYTEMMRGYTVINCIGIQSFNEDSLKAINRIPVKYEAFNDFIRLIKKHNLVLKIDMILGLPEETEETYLKGIEFLIDTIIDSDSVLNIHRLQILPGSKLEEKADRLGLRYNKDHLVYETNTLNIEKMRELIQISGLVFRIVNSPLRALLKNKKHKRDIKYLDIIKEIRDKCIEKYPRINLFVDENVSDDYWSGKIFEDIKTDFLIKLLED